MTGKDVLHVTPKAAERVRALLAVADPDVLGLEIGIEKGGCTGMVYKIDYIREIPDHAEVVRGNYGTLVISPASVLFLLGAEMDFEETLLHSKFVFRNPNEQSKCACGLSIAF